MVSRLGLSLLSVPNKSTGKCGNEWSTFGTCCKVDQLEALATKDRQLITTSADLFAQEYAFMIDLVRNKIYQPLTNVLSEINLKPSLAVVYGLNSTEKAKLVFLKNSPVMQFFRMGEATSLIETFKKELMKCWNFQAGLRSKALCSTCSANSARFFNNSLGLASLATCNQLITECQVAVLHSNRVIFAMNQLRRCDAALQRVGIKVNVAEKLSPKFEENLMDYVSKLFSDMRENFQADLNSLLQNSREARAMYCDELVRLDLASLPYIVRLMNVINSGVPWKVIVAQSRALRVFEPASRSLESSTRNLLSSDFSSQLQQSQDTSIMTSEFGQASTTASNTMGTKSEPINFGTPFP